MNFHDQMQADLEFAMRDVGMPAEYVPRGGGDARPVTIIPGEMVDVEERGRTQQTVTVTVLAREVCSPQPRDVIRILEQDWTVSYSAGKSPITRIMRGHGYRLQLVAKSRPTFGR